MNNETYYLQQLQRLNEIIDVLLKDNACLKSLLAASLPNGKGLTDTETELARLMIGNSEVQNHLSEVMIGNTAPNTSHQEPMEGNNEINISHHDMLIGNSAMNHSYHQPMLGNIAENISNHGLMAGNNQTDHSNHGLQQGINEQQLAVVQENVRQLMKKAILASHLTTSKILIQLRADPATSLSQLRKLTGLTEDGMAKRIMAMKKAGLVQRFSAPLRYVLTDKAKELFVEKRR